MTTEERFERIEHLTAGLAEERSKDRHEYKALWRDTQRQINETAARMLQLTEETAEADKRLGERIDQLTSRIQQHADDSREADRRLEARIESLVSAIG
jgi:DNA-binding transcriptional regulator GbsR (MarR family)